MRQIALITLALILFSGLFFYFNRCTDQEAIDTIQAIPIDKDQTQAATTLATTASIYQKRCQPCHGSHGQLSALSKSDIINTWSATKIEQALMHYKNGKRDAKGLGRMMHGQAEQLSDDEIKALANYIATLSL